VPQFDIFANPVTAARRAYPLVVWLQSDLVSDGTDVVVAPLVPRRNLAGSVGRLTPVVSIDGTEYIVLITSLTSLPSHDLGQRIANIASHRQTLMAAIDLLFFGI
jgi:toxin CcdB